LNLIDFDGVDDRLASGSNSPNYQAITVFVAEIHDSFTPANANTARLIEVGNNLRRVIIGETTTGIPILTRAFSFFASSSATALDVQGTADSAPVGRFQILTTAWAGGLPNQNVSLRTQRLACNGGATSGTGTYTSTLNAVTHIGARAADNLRNLDGAIGELIVYSYGLSVSAIQLVEAYLMRKWAA